MNNLPSKEEYIKTLNYDQEDMKAIWNKELFKCSRCNGGMKRDFSVSYMTNPPKYRYFCKDCGAVEIF